MRNKIRDNKVLSKTKKLIENGNEKRRQLKITINSAKKLNFCNCDPKTLKMNTKKSESKMTMSEREREIQDVQQRQREVQPTFMIVSLS